MQTHSRKAFEIGKIGAISEVVSKAPALAFKAYYSLAEIPIVGPALGAAAAAAALLFSASQVQAINSASYGGGGAVGVGTFAANPSTGLPESPTGSGFLAPRSPIAGTPAQQARNINITFIGNGRYTQEEIREALVPALQEAFDAGVTVDF